MAKMHKTEVRYAVTDGDTFYSNELMTWGDLIETDISGWTVIEMVVTTHYGGRRTIVPGRDCTDEAIEAYEREQRRPVWDDAAKRAELGTW